MCAAEENSLQCQRSVPIVSCVATAVLLSCPFIQGQERTDGRLPTVAALQCVFRLVVNANWRSGAPYVDVKPTALRMSFTDVNADEGTATASGQFGRSVIVAKLASGSLHFIQSFRDGPLYVTTVFGDGSSAPTLKAVHTRHEYSGSEVPGFTSSPEQYYGQCEIER